ncbi:MAG: polysaccharide deacetylase family protein [Kiloniellaceae bacterium]
MTLPTHGRYGYRAITDRPDYDWPNGKRLAVYFGLNLEHFAFGEGLGAKLAPAFGEPDVLNYAWRDYGNRVGVWRMLEIFDALALPTGVLVNSTIYGYCPAVVAAFRARGDEIIGHGRTNAERQAAFDEAGERALIAEATKVLTEAEGRAPQGWLGPWISESVVTPDLLQEAGYRYILDWCGDDQPIWLKTRQGRILAVPYPQEVNDIPAIPLHRLSPADFTDLIVDNFEEMLEQSKAQALVMGIALHPYLVGQPYRLRHLRRALEHIAAKRDDIWLTTPGAIAAHVIANDLAV